MSSDLQVRSESAEGPGLQRGRKGGDLLPLKEKFCERCRLLYAGHLVAGVGGNLSARVGEHVFLTHTGYSLRDLTPERVVVVTLSGGVVDGGIPTKDSEMHLEILRRREDIDVVCHVHGAFLIALSSLVEAGPDVLPPITPGFIYLAHPLAMVPFLLPGSRELADAVAQEFSRKGCRAVLLQNHGLVACGKDFSEALNIAEEIEEAAKIYVLTQGRMRVICEEDVDRIKRLP